MALAPDPGPQVIIPYKQLCDLLKAGEENKQLRAEVLKLSKQVDALRVIQRECINQLGELRKLL